MSNQEPEKALEAVDRICASGSLGRNSRQGTLLQHLVHEELAGRGDALKAYVIALDVFKRPNSFDPAKDSIVRVEMGRLRQSLDHYYTTSGQFDEIRITIPKGSYRPIIETSKTPPVQNLWERPLSLMILPFSSLDSDREIEKAASSISLQLFAEISHNKAINLIRSGLRHNDELPTDISAFSRARGVQFVIHGAVHSSADGLRVVIDLMSTETAKVVWAQSYETKREPTRQEQDALTRQIATDVRPIFYNSEKLRLEELPEEKLTAEQLFVLSTWISGDASYSLSSEMKRLELAKRAVELKPEYGKAHSVLADKYAYLAAIDPQSDSPERIETAKQHAKLARKFSPNDTDVSLLLTMHHWHLGDLTESIRAAKRTMELEPSHGLARMLSFALPYTCAVAPDEIVNRIAEFEASLAPDNPIGWFTRTWRGRLAMNALDFETTLEFDLDALQIMHTPDTIMRTATALYHVGRQEEAIVLVNDQLKLWPNFDTDHLTNVSLKRRRREYVGHDPVLAAYREFSTAYIAQMAP